jgi:hypothetical protein
MEKINQSNGGFVLKDLTPLWLTLGSRITAEFDSSGKLIFGEVKTRWKTSISIKKKHSALYAYCEDQGLKNL